MKEFVVYNSAGTILKTGFCPEEIFHLQCGAGEQILEGSADDLTQMVVNDEIVDKPPLTDEEKRNEVAEYVRSYRSALLVSSDWTQASDSPLTADQRSDWQMYRQKLRDLPADFAHVTSIDDVVWPTAPS